MSWRKVWETSYLRLTAGSDLIRGKEKRYRQWFDVGVKFLLFFFIRLLEEGFVQEAGVEKHRVEQVRMKKLAINWHCCLLMITHACMHAYMRTHTHTHIFSHRSSEKLGQRERGLAWIGDQTSLSLVKMRAGTSAGSPRETTGNAGRLVLMTYSCLDSGSLETKDDKTNNYYKLLNHSLSYLMVIVTHLHTIAFSSATTRLIL